MIRDAIREYKQPPKTWVLKITPLLRGGYTNTNKFTKSWVLKIIPVKRSKMRKQTVQITRVLKIVPAIRSGIYKHKQTVQITRVLKITPTTRDGIREYEQHPNRRR